MGTRNKSKEDGTRVVLEGAQRWDKVRLFGLSLAMSGDTLAAGSLDPGVRVYQRVAARWLLRQTISTPGWSSVALDGDTLALGPGAPGPTAGTVTIYGRSGSLWVGRATLSAPDARPFDTFGSTLALSGTTLLATARIVNIDTQPFPPAYIFFKGPSGWQFDAELKPIGADSRGEAFGNSVALDKDTAVIGAPPFAVYVYQRRAGAWTQEARLTLPDLTTADSFGSSVSISGNLIVIADANGRGAFIASRTGGSWRFVAHNLGKFATSGSVSGDTVAVGYGPPGEPGAVQLYRQDSTGWQAVRTIGPPVGSPGGFGGRVVLGSRVLAVGAIDFPGSRGTIYEFGSAPSEEGTPGDGRLHPALAAVVKKIAAPARAARLLVLTPYPHPAQFQMISSSRMLTWGFKAHGIDYILHHPGVERSDLEDFDAVFCWAYGFKQRPAALASCLEFEAAARAEGIPVINSLASFSIAHSSCLRAWHAAGIPCAPYEHVSCAADITLPYPVILRTDGVHRGQHMHLARNRAEADEIFARAARNPLLPRPNLAIQFIDTRDADGYFRKWRSHVIGARVVPRQAQLSTSWIVNLDGARPLPKAVEEDRKFYRSGDPNPDMLVRAAAALGSEIVALDYSKRGDDYIFWEGNRNFDLSVGGPMWRQFRTATGRSDAETVESVFRLADNIAEHVLEVVAARGSTRAATQRPAARL
jgi:hypothetical protein